LSETWRPGFRIAVELVPRRGTDQQQRAAARLEKFWAAGARVARSSRVGDVHMHGAANRRRLPGRTEPPSGSHSHLGSRLGNLYTKTVRRHLAAGPGSRAVSAELLAENRWPSRKLRPSHSDALRYDILNDAGAERGRHPPFTCATSWRGGHPVALAPGHYPRCKKNVRVSRKGWPSLPGLRYEPLLPGQFGGDIVFVWRRGREFVPGRGFCSNAMVWLLPRGFSRRRPRAGAALAFFERLPFFFFFLARKA